MIQSQGNKVFKWLANLCLILVGTILFFIGGFVSTNESTGQSVIFHIAGALAGAGLVYLLLRVFDPVELDDLQKIIDDRKNDEVKRVVASMIQKSTEQTTIEFLKHSIDPNIFYNELGETIRGLNQRVKVIAVCGDKEWTTPVNNYMDANYEAISYNGVEVNRIFIEDDFFRREETFNKMAEQNYNGVKIHFVKRDNVPVEEKIYYLPPGYGFVIINREVFVHNRRICYRFSNDLIREHFRQIYYNLEKVSIDEPSIQDKIYLNAKTALIGTRKKYPSNGKH